jgi:dihydrofolate synthase/folylpolyglutamate synthase
MAVLGDTLAKIAGEKAGIIKKGVPVVSSAQKEEALEVLERVATLNGCEFTLVGKDIEYESISQSLDGQLLRIIDDLRHLTLNCELPLLGIHQLENAVTAYAALKTSGLEVSDEAIKKGFAQVKWQARFEVVRRDPPVIFDSAHNDDSFEKLHETLDTYFPGKMVTLIFGASEDKNIPGMFAAMKPKIKRLIVTRADHPRALEPEKIIELADQAGIESEAVTPVGSALAQALENSAKDGSIVLSAGSMFVTAEVMKAWQERYSGIDTRNS